MIHSSGRRLRPWVVLLLPWLVSACVNTIGRYDGGDYPASTDGDNRESDLLAEDISDVPPDEEAPEAEDPGETGTDGDEAPPADGDGQDVAEQLDITDVSDFSDQETGPAISLRIATYNVRRLFDTTCDSGSCGGDEYEELPDLATYQAKIQATAEAIDTIDAHIVLLQEIETQGCLSDLSARLGGRYTVVRLGETGGDASVDVGVLAGGTLQYTHDYRADGPIPRPGGGSTTFSRAFFEVHVRVEGQLVILFVTHFKSKSDDDPSRRLAEAMAARDIVTGVAAQHPEALVVMGGDLNDTPGSDPLNTLEQGGLLVRVAGELDNNRDATYYYGGPQAIDHLYLAETAAGRYTAGSAVVVKDGYYRLGDSDHAALRAAFTLGTTARAALPATP